LIQEHVSRLSDPLSRLNTVLILRPVASIPRIPWLKSFFELRFNQYLGRISFSLYLLHGPVLWTLGDRIYLAVGWSRKDHIDGIFHWMNIFPLSKSGPLGLEPAFLIPHLILLPFTLWLSEISTKLFDQPSIRLPQWLYRQALASLPES
jgi:peptidoglycan/LPS O-acetylase OafA/YrhL